jgi:hypothetical protein
MTELSGSEPKPSTDTPVAHPAATGELERSSSSSDDYRDELRSRRWNAAPLENPEVEKTDPRIAVLAIVAMSVVTLVVLVIGYGVVDLWSLPG